MHIHARRQILTLLHQTVEVMSFALACGLGLMVHQRGNALSAFSLVGPSDVAVLAVAFGLAIGPKLRAPQGPRIERGTSVLQEYTRGTVVACATVVVGALLIESQALLSRGFLIAFGTSLFMLRVTTRLVSRQLLAALRRCGYNLRHVMIVGSGARANQIIRTIDEHSEYGYSILGYIDDEFAGSLLPGRHLGTLKHLQEVLDKEQVDEVFLTLPMRSHYDSMLRAAALCEERGIPVHVVANLFGLEVASTSVHQFGELPIFSLISSGPMTGLPYLCKLVIDRVGAALLLALFSPILLATAVAILLTMGRPIFYSQPRVGFHRRVFKCLKFRTMERDADQRMAELESRNDMSGPVFKIHDDSRVTSLGRYLRRFSIDELPQLINVLKGEMSLVGPRPLPLRDVKQFDRVELNRRFSVWPGITCTWQVSGRNELDFEDWIRLDLEYVDSWSLLKDFKILLRTVTAVLGGRGAY
jgi:exopolysaccharide biosynthesis polyprenyl glycosylphosphotransferase